MVVFSCPCAVQVVAERLLHHHAGAVGAAGGGDALCDAAEQERWNLQVEQCAGAGADLAGHRGVGGVVVEVTVDVAQQAEHLLRGRAVGIHVVQPQRGGGVVPELVEAPAALRDPDHRHVEDPAFDEPDQRGEGLELGQVTGRAEDDQASTRSDAMPAPVRLAEPLELVIRRAACW